MSYVSYVSNSSNNLEDKSHRCHHLSRIPILSLFEFLFVYAFFRVYDNTQR